MHFLRDHGPCALRSHGYKPVVLGVVTQRQVPSWPCLVDLGAYALLVGFLYLFLSLNVLFT